MGTRPQDALEEAEPVLGEMRTCIKKVTSEGLWERLTGWRLALRWAAIVMVLEHINTKGRPQICFKEGPA